VLLLSELSSKHLAMSERLSRHRADATERLVASIALDIRSSIASVVYSADFLSDSGGGITPALLTETLRDISKASANLQLTLDVLLDYARLGPTVCVPVSVRDVINRAVGSVRAHYRAGAHRLRVDIAPRAEWVRGNPLTIEQILFSLLLNAVEACASPGCVIVTAFLESGPALLSPSDGWVCIRVSDDGVGISKEHREHVFQPFFTTKAGNLGLGLAMARQAAENLQGTLELMDDESETCFSLRLPCCEGNQ
jgi:signal transduction histidine kinase